MGDGIFIIVIIICVIVLIYALIKLSEGLNMRKQVFSLNDNQVKAVKAMSYSELRSESCLNKLESALKPKVLSQLKSPASAILCPMSQVSIEEKEGKFIVKGYVDSQNEFGAMKRANFRAKCVYYPDSKFWLVENIFLYE